MGALTVDKLMELLGTEEIPGSAEERAILCIRVGELVAINSEKWVRRNRKRLLDEWSRVVSGGYIKS